MLCRLGKTRGHNGDDLSYQSWPFTRAVKRARISMTPLVNGEKTRKEHSLKVANEIRKALVLTHSCFCGPLESWRSLGHPNKGFLSSGCRVSVILHVGAYLTWHCPRLQCSTRTISESQRQQAPESNRP